MRNVHPTTQVRAAAYLRISLDATGDRLAVDRQREDCQKLAANRGWEIVAEFVDNSVSASDRKVSRPGYDALVAGYERGDFGAIICYDLDRLTRQPRQLEDWIDRAESRGLLLVTTSGEADLGTDNGRLFGRIKAAVGRSEVERKSARQRSASAQRFALGRLPGGVRLTGYAPDGSLVPAEAVIVRALFDRFMAGDSLRGITAWLESTGVPSRSGRPWNPAAVRKMLANPRYCGRATYHGATNGVTGDWSAIVDAPLFDLVQAKLSDPRRKTAFGTDRRWLGSSLYRCGVCGRALIGHGGKNYKCAEGGHVSRRAAQVDGFVLEVLRRRLAMPDLAGLLTAQDDPAAVALAAEAQALRARLATVEADYDDALISGARYSIASAKLNTLLAAAQAKQLRAMRDVGVAGTLTAPDPVAAFDAAPLMVQREVVAFFLTATLMKAPRGVHEFDPESVIITWRRPAE